MDNPVKICVLGVGVIGTTYGYVFQKAGHQVEHLVRENQRNTVPKQLSVHLLDGRYNNKGEEKQNSYTITLAQPYTSYDFILVSVASGNVKNAVETLASNGLSGTLILFCNFWNDRQDIVGMVDEYPYIVGFPTAGGCMEQDNLNCVLFDHIMMENEVKANIPNYDDLSRLLITSDIAAKVPHDMVEWIWLHMAINAGVTSSAARNGQLENPRQLALNLMGDSKALSEAVKTIRETILVVASRGVDLRLYNNEIMPYKFPSVIAGVVMKRMFAGNELTSRIMTLHNDIDDILYGCTSVYNTAKDQGLNLPLYYKKMDKIYSTIKKD
ncbi:MAG: ketopantoate reductase family protein [Oscillospiraceae bacterium]|jgi:2-dehydropantoate 2-reductase|nr:ketopantoate reductase family protein [Oscillospiraceae bacterium]